MPDAGIVYARAMPSDAVDLAEFGAQSFRDAYGDSSTPAALALHLERTYSAALQRAELEDPRCWTFLARRGAEVLGAALLRWQQPPLRLEPKGKWAEIRRFYVGRPHWRTGVSTALMSLVLQSIPEGGGSGAWLQVWERAETAIRFYRKWGFLEAGSVPFLLGSETQTDLLMVRNCA